MLRLVRQLGFYASLLAVDKERAERMVGMPCPLCGQGVLSPKGYRRKPRGYPPGFDSLPDWDIRRSLICTKCGRRVMPESALFLGRRVYLAPVVLAASMLEGSADVEELSRLRERFPLARHTLARWRAWWLVVFVATRFWKSFSARLVPPVDLGRLPLALVERFGRTIAGIRRLLQAIGPLTTSSPATPEGATM
jgi:hypothetical protein